MLKSRIVELENNQRRVSNKIQVEDHLTKIEGWDLLERNQYLEHKLSKLKEEQIRQSSHLNKLRNSEKWKNREKCKQK